MSFNKMNAKGDSKMYGTYTMLSNYVSQDSRPGIPKLRDESNEDIVDRYLREHSDFDLARVYVKNFAIMYNIAKKFPNINTSDKGSKSLDCCFRAVTTYKTGNSLFISWLTLCWQRQLITVSQKNERTKNVTQCEALLDESDVDFNNGEVSTDYKMINRLSLNSTEHYSKVDFNINFKTLLDTGIWKDDERAVLIGAYYGMTDNEISSSLGVSNAQVYWARKRVRNVLTSNKKLYNLVF